MSTLQGLSTEQFRQKVAGLLDPSREVSDLEKKNLKEEAIRFLSILAKHYRLRESRTEMWGDIGNVVEKSLAKLGGSPDLERLANDCMEGIHADIAISSACPAFAQMIEVFDARDVEWCSHFCTALKQHLRTWIVFARTRYKDSKEGTVEL